MKCANIECINDLSEWEEKRIKFKFTAADFCRKCRWKHNYTNFIIRCRSCGEGFRLVGFKIYCGGCYKKRRNESSRIRQVTYRTNQKQIKLKSDYNKKYYKNKQLNNTIKNI